ncbi:MAG: hypothetical protein AAGF88_01190 [Pseudomonadota bacterium]
MVSGRSARVERVGIRIDRVVAAVAITALALSITIGVRTGANRIAGANMPTLAGIRLLAPDDSLVTFEDFELGAPGWDGSRLDHSTPVFGGMLGRYGGTDGAEAVARTYQIPPDAGFAVVTFHLHAIDDWALEDVVVFANGIEVIRQSFTTRADLADSQRLLMADLPWIAAEVRPAMRSGSERGFGRDGDGTRDQTVRVRLVLTNPPEELRLGFGATLPGEGIDTASWAIDNVQIVTSPRLPTRQR